MKFFYNLLSQVCRKILSFKNISHSSVATIIQKSKQEVTNVASQSKSGRKTFPYTLNDIKDIISVYIEPFPRQEEKKRKTGQTTVKKSKQPPSHTADICLNLPYVNHHYEYHLYMNMNITDP